VDWLTLKIKPTGVLQWSKRYDKTSNNDEYPEMLIVDAGNNIYVTGIGGPFPGGSNLGAEQGVVIKYKSGGIIAWTALADTLNFEGASISLASDSSLYVISAALQATVIHFLQYTGNDSCAKPVNISAGSITNYTAIIHWTAVPDAYLFHVKYKSSPTNVWTQLSTDSTSVKLTGLSAGTIYDYIIEAVCNSGPTGYSTTHQFTTTGTGYCAALSTDATQEWINYIGLNAISNYSASEGYADFTYLSAVIAKGSTQTISTRASINPFGNTEVWRIWIDYNHDNDFNDAGELIVAFSSMQVGLEDHTFIVPTTATTGSTRMRIAMKRTTAPSSCGTFSPGEVEDYNVNITPFRLSGDNAPVISAASGISLFPNPAHDFINVKFAGFMDAVTIEIYNLQGKIISKQQFAQTDELKLNIRDLTNGIYFIRGTDEQMHSSMIKFIRQ
jgi:hypothetical protein